MLFLAFLLPEPGYCGDKAASTMATVLCKDFICKGETYKDSMMTVKINIVLNLEPGLSSEKRKTLEQFYRQVCYILYGIAWWDCREDGYGDNNTVVIKEAGKAEISVNKQKIK